jgi:hypothetical protein
MAEIKRQKIVCPKCSTEFEVGIWDKIEMPYDEEQKEKIITNTFFRAQCTSCQSVFPMMYDCEYNDLERKYLIWIIPKLLEGEKVRIMEFNKRLATDNRLRLAQGGYRYRLVRSDNELREKVLIFDEGLDDRFIETMKLAYVPVIRKNVDEQYKIFGVFFDKDENGKYQWVVIFDKRQPLILDVDMSIYEDMKEKLWDVAEAKTQKGLAYIESHWALQVMQESKQAEDEE